MGWVGEMGREDWKMGMISDCDELQKNQAQNDPLTVKTPSPLHWFPSCLVDAGRQVAGALSPADPPAAALPSSGPPPAMLPAMGSNSSRAQVPQSLAPQGFLANAEKVQIPAFTRAKVRQIDRGSRAGSRAGRRSFPPVEVGEVGEVGEDVARGSPGAVLLSSCPAPVHAPISRNMPACQAGRRAKAVFPFR